MAGLKNDGSTGVNAFQIYGEGNFRGPSGHSLDDGGAASHGTQAGPNYLQIAIAADGAAYTLRTSADGVTWTDEFSAVLPSPLTNATDANSFGIAVFLPATDKGEFTIEVDVWTVEDAVFGSQAEVSFTAWAEDVNSGNPRTFNDVSFGAADPSRIIVVCVWNDHSLSGSDGVTGVTIGGVTASMAISGTHPNTDQVSIWYAEAPTETSGTVVVNNADGSSSLTVIHVHRIVGASSAAPHDTLHASSSGGTPSGGLDVPAGGVVVGIAGNRSNGSSFTWPGLTERSDVNTAGLTSSSSANGDFPEEEINKTVSVTNSAGTFTFMEAASWG